MAGLDVLVVDDERPAREELRFLLDQDRRVGTVLEAGGGIEGLRILENHRVDAKFLEIAMPVLSRIELPSVLARFEHPPAIVFVTAHEEYAVEAFEINVVDYLLKPLTAERVGESLRRLLGREDADSDDESLAVERGGVNRFISRTGVFMVDDDGVYVLLHIRCDHHLLRTPLTSLADSWRNAGFVRIHRSY